MSILKAFKTPLSAISDLLSLMMANMLCIEQLTRCFIVGGRFYEKAYFFLIST